MVKEKIKNLLTMYDRLEWVPATTYIYIYTFG